MTLPTPTDVHVNVPLSNMSVAYMQSLDAFGADYVAPMVPSENQSNSFFKFSKEYWFRDEMKLRGPGAPAARAGYGITTDSFFCHVWAVAKLIDDQTRANEDAPLNSDRNAMQYLTRLERLRREKSFVATAFGTGIWGHDVAGVSGAPAANQVKQWDQATATPLADIAAERIAIKLKTGFTPNVLVIGEQVWQYLKNSPDILGRISGGATTIQPSKVTKQLVAQLMELDEIIVMGAVENIAKEGQAFSGAFLVGKQALLLYRDPTMSIETVTSIRTFVWRRLVGTDTGVRILKYREEPHNDVIEIESAFCHKIIAPDTGTYYSALVA